MHPPVGGLVFHLFFDWFFVAAAATAAVVVYRCLVSKDLPIVVCALGWWPPICSGSTDLVLPTRRHRNIAPFQTWRDVAGAALWRFTMQRTNSAIDLFDGRTAIESMECCCCCCQRLGLFDFVGRSTSHHSFGRSLRVALGETEFLQTAAKRHLVNSLLSEFAATVSNVDVSSLFYIQ